MSRRITARIFTILAAVAMLLPLTTKNANAKNTKGIVKTTMTFQNPVSLGGTQLKPGVYDVTATDNKITILNHGKAVAQAPIEWKNASSKANNSTIVSESGSIVEFHFQGKARYVAVTNESAGNK